MNFKFVAAYRYRGVPVCDLLPLNVCLCSGEGFFSPHLAQYVYPASLFPAIPDTLRTLLGAGLRF